MECKGCWAKGPLAATPETARELWNKPARTEREKTRERNRKVTQRRVDNGLCLRCRKPNPDSKYKCCYACRIKAAERRNAHKQQDNTTAQLNKENL